jgi:hypothetical protein
MLGLALLLLALAVAFDVFYLHRRRARITERRQAQHEVWPHVARGVVFDTLVVFVMSNALFEGAYHAAFVALCGVSGATVAIAVADMLCELDARRRHGLPEARTFPTSRSWNSEHGFARLRGALVADAGCPVGGRAQANDGCEAMSSQAPRREPGPHRRALAGTPG